MLLRHASHYARGHMRHAILATSLSQLRLLEVIACLSFIFYRPFTAYAFTSRHYGHQVDTSRHYRRCATLRYAMFTSDGRRILAAIPSRHATLLPPPPTAATLDSRQPSRCHATIRHRWATPHYATLRYGQFIRLAFRQMPLQSQLEVAKETYGYCYCRYCYSHTIS